MSSRTETRDRPNPRRGSNTSRAIRMGEAYWQGTHYRLHVWHRVDIDIAYLTLTGARDLARRLDAAIKRLEKVRPTGARKFRRQRSQGSERP